eukprot:322948-Amphidinium_carterae.2
MSDLESSVQSPVRRCRDSWIKGTFEKRLGWIAGTLLIGLCERGSEQVCPTEASAHHGDSPATWLKWFGEVLLVSSRGPSA